MDRQDLPEVQWIEETSFSYPWTESEMRAAYRCRAVEKYVLQVHTSVIGFAFCEQIGNGVYDLHNVAISEDHRRQRYGTRLLTHIKTRSRVRSIQVSVWERNLPMQLFLRANGFRAVRIKAGEYDECEDQTYVFRWRKKQ